MKESSGHTLGYLAAFTLGLICMAVVLVTVHFLDAPREADRTASSTKLDPPGSNPSANTTRMLPRRSASAARFSPETEEPDSPSTLAGADDPEVTDEEPTLPAGREHPLQVINSTPISAGRGADRIGSNSTRGSLLSGRVQLRGTPPSERLLPMGPDCAAQYPAPPTTQFYVVGKDNGLADVLVHVTAGLPEKSWRASAEPLLITEEACLFHPYVAAVQTGRPVVVRNLSDDMHALTVTSQEHGNVSRSLLRGAELTYTFNSPEEFIRFKCDVHPWEFSYVSALPHPFFAVTDENGNFAIRGLPPGKYTLEARHRKAGTVAREIAVVENRGTTVEFTLEVHLPEVAAN